MNNQFHSRSYVIGLTLLILILTSTGCQGFLGPEPTITPLISVNTVRGLNMQDCPFSVPQGVEMTCGVLEAPKDYAQTEGETIELFTAIVHSPNPAKASDAVVLLPQNAGVSLREMVGYIGRQIPSILESRDLVFYEYRGLGQKEIDLNCPEYYEAYLQTWLGALSPDQEAELYFPALETCRDRMLNDQVDHNVFTVDQMAADLNLLRLASGYSQFNLLAGGFGSELALTMLRDYPLSLRSVAIFDLAFPKTYLTAEMQAVGLQQSLDLLSNRCMADEKCRLAYPDLESRLYAAIEQLNLKPAEIKLFFPNQSNLVPIKVTGYDFLILLRDLLRSNATINDVPKLVNDVSSGKVERISVEMQQYRMNTPPEMVMGLEINAVCDGLHTNFMQITPASQDVKPIVLEAIQAEWQVLERLCPTWTGHDLEKPAGQAISSEIPTMILQGDFSPTLSPETVDELLRGMKNAEHYVIPNIGNDAFGGGSCAGLLYFEWLDDPTSKLDASCLEETEPINFRMPDM